MHHGNTLAEGIHRVFNLDGLPVNQDLPFIHFIDAEHALHQCALACAVFSHQCMDFAGAKPELYVVKGFYTGECLGNVPHLENKFRHIHASYLWKSDQCSLHYSKLLQQCKKHCQEGNG